MADHVPGVRSLDITAEAGTWALVLMNLDELESLDTFPKVP